MVNEEEENYPDNFEKSLFWLELAGYSVTQLVDKSNYYNARDPEGKFVGVVNKSMILEQAHRLWNEYYNS